MKIWKNLFGNGDKISASEIAYKQGNNIKTVEEHLADKLPHDNVPYAKIYTTGDQTQTIPNNVVTHIVFNATEKDNNGMADLGSNRLVIKTAGTYLMICSVFFSINSVGNREIFLYKNGSLYPTAAVASSQAAAAPSGTTCNALRALLLEVGDTVSLGARQSSGGSLSVIGSGDGQRVFLLLLRVGD